MLWIYLGSIASAGANGFWPPCCAFFLSIFELVYILRFFFLFFAKVADLVFTSFHGYSTFLQGCWIQQLSCSIKNCILAWFCLALPYFLDVIVFET